MFIICVVITCIGIALMYVADYEYGKRIDRLKRYGDSIDPIVYNAVQNSAEDDHRATDRAGMLIAITGIVMYLLYYFLIA